MTLPMSFMPAAPVSATAASMAAATCGLVHLLGHEAHDDGDLLALLVGELGAGIVLVDLQALLALLHHLLQQAEDLVVGQRLLAGAARLDVAVLEGRR